MSSHPVASASSSPPLYAGFWRRVAAYFVDSIVVLVAAAFLLLPFSFTESFAWIGSLAVLVFFLAYFIMMNSSGLQATIGKLVLGVKVTDGQGNRIGTGRSAGRFLGTFVSSLVLGVGYLLAGWTERRQALHDMIAGTLVVRRGATPADIVAGGVPMPNTLGVWTIIIGLAIVSFLFGMALSFVGI
jgi:uncharacterized RDD family membrane protein YckC